MSNNELLEQIRQIVREEIAQVYPEERYLSVNDACKYMGISRAKLYEMMSDGLPWGSWNGGSRHIDRRLIDNLFFEVTNDPLKLIPKYGLKFLYR